MTYRHAALNTRRTYPTNVLVRPCTAEAIGRAPRQTRRGARRPVEAGRPRENPDPDDGPDGKMRRLTALGPPSCYSSGLPRQRFHDLRHACAALRLEAGEELLIVSRILGHSTLTTGRCVRPRHSSHAGSLSQAHGTPSSDARPPSLTLVRRAYGPRRTVLGSSPGSFLVLRVLAGEEGFEPSIS